MWAHAPVIQCSAVVSVMSFLLLYDVYSWLMKLIKQKFWKLNYHFILLENGDFPHLNSTHLPQVDVKVPRTYSNIITVRRN